MDALEYESDEDYAFYARCRGLSEKRLLLCHFLPRAAIGLVPNFLQSIGLALANATVIESIFSIPGFGWGSYGYRCDFRNGKWYVYCIGSLWMFNEGYTQNLCVSSNYGFKWCGRYCYVSKVKGRVIMNNLKY